MILSSPKKLTQKRSLDGITRSIKTHIIKQARNVKGKKTAPWVWFFVLALVANIGFFGIMSAGYVKKSIDVFSLFRDGKFLVLFQNNSELRSSGGFIGSFAVAEMENYQIKNLNFNTNIYSIDNAFAQGSYIEAPFPIKKMTDGQSWGLRDANYDASFDEASQDILNLYQQETGDQVDAVIGLNAQVIVDLLAITGPIYLEKYDLAISKDNFYYETQSQVEREYYKDPENWAINEPKTFIKDLYPLLLRKALENKIALLGVIKKELAQKEIIFYFKNSLKQEIVEEQNWAGKIASNEELKSILGTSAQSDFLYLVDNSYSGNKSSINIKEKIDYKIIDAKSNFYQANLKITRIHTGSNEWPDGKNVTWLRAYAPKESKFLEATLNSRDVSDLIEIDLESDKISFGFEVITDPGQISILEISYLIPKSDPYQLLVQKQPGKINDELTVNLNGQILYDGVLDKDIKIFQE